MFVVHCFAPIECDAVINAVIFIGIVIAGIVTISIESKKEEL